MFASLSIYTIYEKPSDFPDRYVCRRSEIRHGEVIHCELVAEGFSLDEVRKHLLHAKPNLYRLPRQVNDDTVIVECWF